MAETHPKNAFSQGDVILFASEASALREALLMSPRKSATTAIAAYQLLQAFVHQLTPKHQQTKITTDTPTSNAPPVYREQSNGSTLFANVDTSASRTPRYLVNRSGLVSSTISLIQLLQKDPAGFTDNNVANLRKNLSQLYHLRHTQDVKHLVSLILEMKLRDTVAGSDPNVLRVYREAICSPNATADRFSASTVDPVLLLIERARVATQQTTEERPQHLTPRQSSGS